MSSQLLPPGEETSDGLTLPVTEVPAEVALPVGPAGAAPSAPAPTPNLLSAEYLHILRPSLQRVELINDVVRYGSDNLLPDALLNVYLGSPTMAAIVDRLVQMLIGEGIDVVLDGQVNTAATRRVENVMQGAGAHELLRRLAFDYYLFGGAMAQVVTFDNGQVADVLHQPWAMCRQGVVQAPAWLTPTLSDGTATERVVGCVISRDWARVNDYAQELYQPYRYPYFNPKAPAGEGPQFVRIARYSPLPGPYPLPRWMSAYYSAATEADLIGFEAAFVANAFVPSGVFNADMAMGDERIKKFRNDIEMHRGPRGAGRQILATREFGEGGGGTRTFEPIQMSLDKGTQSMFERIRQDVFMAFGIPSPALLGLPGGASLSGDGNTIVQASKELEAREIAPGRTLLLNGLLTPLLKLYASLPPEAELRVRLPGQDGKSSSTVLTGEQIDQAQRIIMAMSDPAARLAADTAKMLLEFVGIPTAAATAMVGAQHNLTPAPSAPFTNG